MMGFDMANKKIPGRAGSVGLGKLTSVLLVFALLMTLAWSLNAADIVPTTAAQKPEVIEPFGAKLFNGNFLKTRGDGLNPDYILAPGDRVAIAVWGAVTISEHYVLDGQGNIFIPDIGPLNLAGVKNAELTETVRTHLKKVYTGNFDVYTNLVTAQPVAVYVTGMVNNPGRYSGIPSDSILYFVDHAGGIDSVLGSYRHVEIIRDGKVINKIDLYDFILQGRLATPQLQENDTILVKQRGPIIHLQGNVARSSMIEMKSMTDSGGEILKIIPQAAQATEVTITGMRNKLPFQTTMTLVAFLGYTLQHGDIVNLRDDGRTDTILVKIEGEFSGPAVLSVKRGSRLVEVLNYIPVDPELANIEAIHLRRKSVAASQKDSISDSLFRLERSTLLALSGSSAEVEIRTKEADLVTKFAERARLIDPLGRVVTVQDNIQQNILLEPDDTIVIPSQTEIIRVAGEVMMMQAMTYRKNWTIADYIDGSGGFTDRANVERIIIHHANAGVTITGSDAAVAPGDEIIVAPRVDFKSRQFALDLVDVIYKIAIAASVAINL